MDMTEPQAGSDAAEQRAIAARKGDVYVINGTKNWITNGPVADAIVLFAMTDPSKGTKGISAFIVDTHPGLRAAAPRHLRRDAQVIPEVPPPLTDLRILGKAPR